MSQAADPFEFIKNFWANVPGMGGGTSPAMPSFDPKDLEKRVGELKQVKQWLEMNLNMLNLQINTMEMQLGALNSFKDGNYAGGYGGAGASKVPPTPQADLDQATEAVSEAAKAAGDAGAQAIAQGAQALQAMPWANPGEWIKSMQAAFGTAAPTGPAKSAKSASKASAKTAGKTAAKPAGKSAAKSAEKSAAKRPARKSP